MSVIPGLFCYYESVVILGRNWSQHLFFSGIIPRSYNAGICVSGTGKYSALGRGTCVLGSGAVIMHKYGVSRMPV